MSDKITPEFEVVDPEPVIGGGDSIPPEEQDKIVKAEDGSEVVWPTREELRAMNATQVNAFLESIGATVRVAESVNPKPSAKALQVEADKERSRRRKLAVMGNDRLVQLAMRYDGRTRVALTKEAAKNRELFIDIIIATEKREGLL